MRKCWLGESSEKNKEKIFNFFDFGAPLGGVVLRLPLQYYLKSFSYQKAFMARLEDATASEKDFDLREFRRGEWDTLQWVAPYEDPCELGEAYKTWWLFCRGAQQDSEFKVFFIKDSVPVAGFRVLRYYLELVESLDIPKNIPREKLVFKFDHFEKYPTVQLHAPQ